MGTDPHASRHDEWSRGGQHQHVDERERVRVKKRQYLAMKKSWNRFWTGTGYLPIDCQRAVDALQADMEIQFMALDEFFGLKTRNRSDCKHGDQGA